MALVRIVWMDLGRRDMVGLSQCEVMGGQLEGRMGSTMVMWKSADGRVLSRRHEGFAAPQTLDAATSDRKKTG